VRIGSAFANVWDFDQATTGGMTLELTDDSEHFLCGACLGRLPDNREVTAEDWAALTEG
jgi:hypothetical protein